MQKFRKKVYSEHSTAILTVFDPSIADPYFSCDLSTFAGMNERKLRIVFMGTPDFAVVSLQFLLEAGYPIVGVITAPDKPGGRGMKQIISSAVKQFATEHQLPVLQPTNLKSSSFTEQLRALKADLYVVVAFRMLPEVVWNMPPLGTLNLHGSLLPAYRGAAPIQWAIINGEKMTGVTTFLLQHEIDTGQILLQREIPILDDDDAGTVHDRMMHVGAALVVASVDQIQTGTMDAQPQDETKVSHAPKIHHDDGQIVWTHTVHQVYDRIRGMSPYPGAWTTLDGVVLKIWKIRRCELDQKDEPGTLRMHDKSLIVQAIGGSLEILEVQLSGKRRMKTNEFLNGYTIKSWSLT